MNEEFEKVYEWTNERLKRERDIIKEYKNDIRQSEALIIGIILVCIIIAFFAKEQNARYIFVIVSVLMFVFCTIYTFFNERKIIRRQNKFSEIALSELAIHIPDGYLYEKEEELSGSFYRKSGFNRIYKEFKSKGIISGSTNGHNISLSNIIVKGDTKELFRGIFTYGTLKAEFAEIDVMRVNSQNNKKEKYEIPNKGLYMYSDQISSARQIMDDEILEFISKFNEKNGYLYEFMINKNMIFFRFYDNEILVKPITNDAQTKEYLYKHYEIIRFMNELIEKIETKVN